MFALSLFAKTSSAGEDVTPLPASELIPESTTTLVVILHGWTVTPAFMVHVKDVCRQSMPAAEFLVPSLPLGFWSSVNPVGIAILAVVIVLDDPCVRAGGPAQEFQAAVHGHGSAHGKLIGRCDVR